MRLSATAVEVFHKHRRVAAQVRGRRNGGYTTLGGRIQGHVQRCS